MGGAKNVTILLVEDEAVIAMAERMQLEQAGYAVTLAYDAGAAIAAAANPAIDLVLMDIDLGPGMDGTKAAQRILQERELPIVFLTSHAEREIVDRVKDITRYGYVLKNSGTFVLLEAVEMALELFRSHRSIAAGERRYWTLFETTENPITIYDEDGTLVEINRVVRQAFDVERDEIIGKPLRELVPDMHDETVRRIRKCLETHERTEYIDRVEGVDGRFFWFRSSFVPLPLETGDRPLVQVMSYDITGLKELERRVESGAGDSFATAVTDVAPLMMYVYDHEAQRNVWANKSYLEMIRDLTGDTASELPRDGIFALLHPEDLEMIRTRERTWGAGEAPAADDLEMRLGTEGDWRWFLHRSVTFERYPNGRPRKIIGFLVDIDARKRAEAVIKETAEGQK